MPTTHLCPPHWRPRSTSPKATFPPGITLSEGTDSWGWLCPTHSTIFQFIVTGDSCKDANAVRARGEGMSDMLSEAHTVGSRWSSCSPNTAVQGNSFWEAPTCLGQLPLQVEASHQKRHPCGCLWGPGVACVVLWVAA
jgi:hypothetical protein